MNKILMQDFINSITELVNEAASVYQTHPDKEELIHFRNTIENVMTYVETIQKLIDQSFSSDNVS